MVLTPGIYNSAYFEHTFLAQQMGVELVQGSDLVVVDDVVYDADHARSAAGGRDLPPDRRRLPRPASASAPTRPSGVAGLMQAYRAGNVTLANAPGTGVADDKAVYAYVPEIIRYYLDEEPILANVPTYLCSDPQQREHVLAQPRRRWSSSRPTSRGDTESCWGPTPRSEEREAYAERIRANPREYIAQPMLDLSTVPTLIGDRLEPRHVDLRPFVLAGEEIYVMPGGLTRVALVEGSMIVNSSQGGGSKDTWVMTHAVE